MKQNKKKKAVKAPAHLLITPDQMDIESLRPIMGPFRRKIDAIDDKIMVLLRERFAVVRQVGKLKVGYNLPSYIHDRVVEVRERNARKAESYGIDPGFIRMLFTMMIYQSCAEEDTIRQAHEKKSAARKKKITRASPRRKKDKA